MAEDKNDYGDLVELNEETNVNRLMAGVVSDGSNILESMQSNLLETMATKDDDEIMAVSNMDSPTEGLNLPSSSAPAEGLTSDTNKMDDQEGLPSDKNIINEMDTVLENVSEPETCEDIEMLDLNNAKTQQAEEALSSRKSDNDDSEGDTESKDIETETKLSEDSTMSEPKNKVQMTNIFEDVGSTSENFSDSVEKNRKSSPLNEQECSYQANKTKASKENKEGNMVNEELTASSESQRDESPVSELLDEQKEQKEDVKLEENCSLISESLSPCDIIESNNSNPYLAGSEPSKNQNENLEVESLSNESTKKEEQPVVVEDEESNNATESICLPEEAATPLHETKESAETTMVEDKQESISTQEEDSGVLKILDDIDLNIEAIPSVDSEPEGREAILQKQTSVSSDINDESSMDALVIDEKGGDTESEAVEEGESNERKENEETKQIEDKNATSLPNEDNEASEDKPGAELTAGEIISLDSSDDEEPKTVEEACLNQDPTAEDQEMEIDEDSSKVKLDKDSISLITAMIPKKDNPDEAIEAEAITEILDKNLEPLEAKDLQDLVKLENENYEIFYNKECINYECPRTHKQFYRATQFTLSFYNIVKKRKYQFVCTDCYMKALEMFEDLCGALLAKQPILMCNIHAGKPEFVEILDSSDEEENPSKNKNEGSSALSADCLSLIEQELEKTIRETFDKVEIQSQLTWSKTILSQRLKHLEEETNKIDKDIKFLQHKADKIHESLYRTPNVKISNLPPLDLNTGKTYIPTEEPLKPFGELTRPPIEINGTYYAVKNKPLASWVPCRVVEKVDGPAGNMKGVPHYKVKFIGSQYHTLKTVPIKHLAYFDPPPVRLQIGTRVIAYFDATALSKGREKCIVQSAFYPGIIAEPLKHNNRFRYLIFYDDGYTQYVHPNDVRLVCQQSEKVWEDVHPGSKDFIENYVTQYNVNRPMVQTHKGQRMNAESNGTWIFARVVDIDCSLVKMQFEQGKGHAEWIYRGSMRLGPVFRENHKMQKESNQSRLRRTEPFIRYTADDEMPSPRPSQRPVPPLAPIRPAPPAEPQHRAVARKTTSRQETSTTPSHPQSTSSSAASTPAPVPNASSTIKHLNNETIYLEDENIPKGKVVYYTAKRNLPPRPYRQHECSKSCLFSIQHNLNVYSPLSKPLLSGWERMIFRQKVKKGVVYRAPCGKMLRDMLEVRNYLRATENVLNVDNFDFRPETCCLAEYVIDKAIITKRDITNGLEKMPLPLVNYYDNTLPDCTYAAQRIPKEDVHITTDLEFLVGCDCEDDCLDKSKCSCWQLTLEGAKYGNPTIPADDVGYQFKRLMDPVPTGIYECNARCKCKSNCLNRVVQHPLQMKLQVFKTNNRGWGLRCINDIPKGSFICIYAGNLLTNTHANEGGLDAGDEYFAELDLIETAEQYKEGYESDVVPPEAEEDDDSLHEEDDEFRPSRSFVQRSKKERATRTSQPSNSSASVESRERRMINFHPNADLDESKRKPSIRQFYGNDDGECYVMDAKTIGNLGRYFNHSCSPNLFVQSVFVDTHDLRFPWVAFFALLNIRAGTELTWNYNYEVGVVPGKVLYCECGAPNCRQRLL